MLNLLRILKKNQEEKSDKSSPKDQKKEKESERGIQNLPSEDLTDWKPWGHEPILQFYLEARKNGSIWSSYLTLLPKELFLQVLEYLDVASVWGESEIELQEVRVMSGHTRSIKCIRLLDDDRIITGSEDKSLRIWSLSSGTELARLEQHTENILTVEVFKPRIYSGGMDRTVIMWMADTFKAARIFEGHQDWIKCIQETGPYMVSGSADCTIMVWKWENGEKIKKLSGHTRGVCCLAPIRNNTLISASWDHSVRWWDLQTGKCLFVAESEHRDNICCLHVNGKLMVTGGCDRLLQLWDMEKKQTIREFSGHKAYVIYCQIIGSTLISSYDHTMLFWNLTTGSSKLVWDKNVDFFLAHRNLLIVASKDLVNGNGNTIQVYAVRPKPKTIVA